jgi:hypothetical protein
MTAQVAQPEKQAEARLQVFSADFEQRLKAAVGTRDPSAMQAGRVSILGLDKVKARFGTQWQRLAGRAARIARNTIERHLGPGDIFTEFLETNYVIVFANLDEPAARVKCLLIADEVMKALLGEDGGDLITVDVDVLGLDRFGFAGKSAAEAPVDNLEFETEAPPPPARRDIMDRVRFTFRPMWDKTHDVLSTYLCVPVVSLSGTDHERDVELEIGHEPEAIARIDQALQAHVLRELARIEQDGDKLLITLCVHYETLAVSAQRRRFQQAHADGLSPQGARLLVIEIVGVPEGVPQSRVVQLVSPLKPMCRAMVARLKIEATDFNALRGTGVSAVGCSLSGVTLSELTIMQHMNRFNREAEKASLASYIYGVRSVSLAAAAIGAGFRYLAGTGVAKLVERPERIVGFNLMDVYRPVLRG